MNTPFDTLVEAQLKLDAASQVINDAIAVMSADKNLLSYAEVIQAYKNDMDAVVTEMHDKEELLNEVTQLLKEIQTDYRLLAEKDLDPTTKRMIIERFVQICMVAQLVPPTVAILKDTAGNELERVMFPTKHVG
jgi:hypothetical protein